MEIRSTLFSLVSSVMRYTGTLKLPCFDFTLPLASCPPSGFLRIYRIEELTLALGEPISASVIGPVKFLKVFLACRRSFLVLRSF